MAKHNQAAASVDRCVPTSTRRARRKLVREVPIRSLFTRSADEIRVHRAISKEAILETAQELHELYLAQKFISDRPSRHYLRPWHLTPAAAMYTAKVAGPKNESIAGSCTLIEDTVAVGLPADRLYAAQLKSLRDRGAFLSEATCFAVSPDYRRTTATTELMRAIFAHALYQKHTHILCIVSTSQRGFYGHLGFSQIGPRKNYSRAHIDPVVLMAADLEELFGPEPLAPVTEPCEAERYWTVDNPYIHLAGDWIRHAIESMKVPSLAQSLYEACPEIMEELEGVQRDAFVNVSAALLERPQVRATALAS